MDSFNQNNLKANLHDSNFSRIGVITLSTDFTIEQDFRKICHNLPVDLFFNRIPFLNPLTHENYLKMADYITCLLYTSPSPRDKRQSRMPSSA